MPKVRTVLAIEEELIGRVRATAERQRWTLTVVAELAFELFLEKFEKAQLPGLTPTEAPAIEEVTA